MSLLVRLKRWLIRCYYTHLPRRWRCVVIRTSHSHPLLIAEIPIGSNGGYVGVSFAPGKFQEIAITGSWARDLDTDLSAIRAWGATHLITLIESWEFDELRIPQLPGRASQLGLQWHGLPIIDGAAPDVRFLLPWETLGPVRRHSRQGGAHDDPGPQRPVPARSRPAPVPGRPTQRPVGQRFHLRLDLAGFRLRRLRR